MTLDLRRSRERVILAREEERLRIRRDLHDGVGPALAGITLGLETAVRRIGQDGPAVALLARLHDECAACVEEIRRIVTDLRPPALDQGRLVDALRRHADVLNAPAESPVVLVEGQDDGLPPLPAAVEVAAYRIALEAMTNAIRHSGGRTCRVCVSSRDGLRITVHDDGTGTPPARVGLGLASMRERAEELGGSCTVTFRQGEGTSMEAVLPVMAS
ncbi:sensor histidine kinase [Micromonospora sp. NPDC006766]|uniref:sensor histidine kinase n=1 Tax=Micromonospora sp. NPDC006766 TaxID=3154778 RepID=UPI0033CDF449